MTWRVNDRPSFPLDGGCACGQVRYRIASLPIALYACHCTDCQRRTGTAFSMNMPVRANTFEITRGKPKGYRALGGPSRTMTTSWFCEDCGTRIHGDRDGRPDVMMPRSGTLDDTSWLRPAAHLFMRSAQPWETIADDAVRFDGPPGDLTDINAVWRSKIRGE